ADVAAAEGLKVETKSALKRGETSSPLSSTTIEAVFRTAKGASASADGEVPGEQVIFQVTDIVVPTLDMASAEAKRIQETLNRSVADDVFNEYVTKLQNDVGVTINQNALRQVVSGQSSAADDSFF